MSVAHDTFHTYPNGERLTQHFSQRDYAEAKLMTVSVAYFEKHSVDDVGWCPLIAELKDIQAAHRAADATEDDDFRWAAWDVLIEMAILPVAFRNVKVPFPTDFYASQWNRLRQEVKALFPAYCATDAKRLDPTLGDDDAEALAWFIYEAKKSELRAATAA